MELLSEATVKPVFRSLVHKWQNRFSDGRNSTEDGERSCRPGHINAGSVNSVRAVIEEERRVSNRKLSYHIGSGRTPIDVNLKENLKLNKICARLMPRILAEETRRPECLHPKFVCIATACLEGNQFLDRRNHDKLFGVQTKQEALLSKRTSSPPPLKARVSKSVKCVMFIFFMDRRGMLLVHAVLQDQSVNASYFSKDCFLLFFFFLFFVFFFFFFFFFLFISFLYSLLLYKSYIYIVANMCTCCFFLLFFFFVFFFFVFSGSQA